MTKKLAYPIVLNVIFIFSLAVFSQNVQAQNNISEDMPEAPMTGMSDPIDSPPQNNLASQITEPNKSGLSAEPEVTVNISEPPETPQAPKPSQSNSAQPLEITADGTLEWHRNELQFIATKNALAQQGDVSLAGEKLTADYRDDAGNNFEIWRVRANTSVRVQSRDTIAYGDEAIYDLTKGYAEITGGDLKLESPGQTVTARDKFEYWTEEGRLIAYGDATITRVNDQGETNTLKADTITAYMKNNEAGKQVLDRMEAEGNVVITTPSEILTGNKGIYNANTNIAEITGAVEIKRGPNILEGTKAEVNLNTNISRMFGSGTPSGQVRGVFYPNAKKGSN